MITPHAKSLKGASSIVLDLLRLLCALVVLAAHSRGIWFPSHWNDLVPSRSAHGSVVVFFVLSGYVIAYTTVNGHRSAYQYAIARLTRLCSVYFPAIAITILCALIALLVNPVIYADFDKGNNIPRYFLSLIYCNEIWFMSAAPVINSPVWSLGYEFWYYVLFGVCIYRFDGWKGWILPLVVAAFVGPKILAMMVIWVMGWAAFHLKKPQLRIGVSWILVAVIMVFSIALMLMLPPMPYAFGSAPLFYGAAFLTDWIVGFFVALAIWLLPTDIEPQLKESPSLKRMRIIANLTFPIYVLHFPLLVLAKCILPTSLDPIFQWAIGGVIALALCVILGLLFESYKNSWKDFFNWLLNTVLRFIKYSKYQLSKAGPDNV